MMKFSLSLKQRMALGMAVLIVPLLVVAFAGYGLFQYAIELLEESYEEVEYEMLPAVRLQQLLLLAQMPANDYLIDGDTGERARFAALREQTDKAFETLLAAPFGIPEKQGFIQRAGELWGEGQRLSGEILMLEEPVGNVDGVRLMRRLDGVLQQAARELDYVSTLAVAELSRQHDFVHKLNARLSAIIAVLLGMLSLLLVAAAVLIRRWVLAPLEELRTAAAVFAEGKLDHRIPVHAGDEIGRVAETFNLMAETLAHDRDVLHTLATQDQLTGLLNVREFHHRLNLELERSRRSGHVLALMMIDVDHFKSVNDRFGHPAGDAVLRQLAERIRGSLRPSDLAARYGGEEFVVMLPETDQSGAQSLAERLCARIRAVPMAINGTTSETVTVSIGIAVYPADADTEERLVALADKALYAAKAGGRDRCASHAALTAVDAG